MTSNADLGRPITLSWSVEDAEQVAQVLHAAAINKQGRIFDHGFEDDALSIWCQIEALVPNDGSTP